MLETQESLNLESAKAYIQKIDFSNIIRKMVTHEGWKEKHALELCEQYKNFLFLNKKYGEKYALPPSEEIDEFWHNHILDTKLYRENCEVIFGKYLDHYPYFGIDEKSDLSDLNSAFQKMLDLYKNEFGCEIYQVRGKFSTFVALIRRSRARHAIMKKAR